jgi:hypothetical protein
MLITCKYSCLSFLLLYVAYKIQTCYLLQVTVGCCVAVLAMAATHENEN